MKEATIADYASIIDQLTAVDDIEVTKFTRAAATFFKSTNAPVPVDIEQLAIDVAAFFPTPFARTFAAWLTLREDFIHADPLNREWFSIKYQSYFDQIWKCWGQIVHFVPFVLLAPLSRLEDDLRQTGGKLLARAFAQYESFYRLSEDQKELDRKKFEGQQCQLLDHLIDLCVAIDTGSKRPSGFFFNALVRNDRRFSMLFPPRYAMELKFIQSSRNRIHGKFGSRTPDVLRLARLLIEAAFLDVVATMVPLSRAYGLYYIDGIDEDGPQPIAETVSFSGAIVAPARFLLTSSDQGAPDAEKFIKRQIYLIERRKELGRSPGPTALQPEEFCDLTPFIVERGRVDVLGPAQDRQLFALDEYRSVERAAFMSFMELAGSALRRLPRSDKVATPSEKQELAKLLEQIGRFSTLVESLADYIITQRRSPIDFAIVRQRAWDRQSKKHLESIIDVRTLKYDGSAAESTLTLEAATTSFDRALFVAPAQAADIERFFSSERRGMLLIGGSGYGKTTLLASSFLDRLVAGDVAIFLSGRKLSKTSLKDILDDVAQFLGNDWGLAQLNDFVDKENAIRKSSGKRARISIFIDAVNEYTSGAGAPALLNEIVDFVVTGGEKTFGQPLPTVRLIATCRTETWLGYRKSPLGVTFDSDSFFCGADGEPIAVTGFDEERARRDLYERYRARYHLTKTPYEKLPPAVASLFRSPLMLVLFAQAYGTTASGETGRSIPRQVGYYRVFGDLRVRKLADSAILVKEGARRKKMLREDGEGSECLTAFATLLYKRLTDRIDPRDYVAIEQTERKPMTKFTADRKDGQMTTFAALLEVGLITEKEVAERNSMGIAIKGRAYTFFHDRYAEHELGRVFQLSVLGALTGAVNRDREALRDLAGAVELLIARAIAFPVLSGALEHWLEINFRANDENAAILVPLASELSRSESGIVRTRVGDTLTAFVVRGTIKAKELYRAIFSAGAPGLRLDLATAAADAWPGIESDHVRDFIGACDPVADEFVIETLADAFAEHANNGRVSGDGVSAVAFVADVFPQLLTLATLVTDLDRLKSHLKFLVRFAQITIVTCAERPGVLAQLRDFLVERFRLVTDFIIARPSGTSRDWLPGALRDLLREQFEWSLYPAWNNTISCDGVNDTFFVDDGTGFVQRDILHQYMPYLCATNNGQFELLSLSDDSPFLELSLLMLNYREYSILGFAAYVSLTIAVRDDHAALRRVITTLMTKGTQAGRFVAVNLIEAYSIINPAFASEAISIITQEMLPHVLDDVRTLAHLVFCAGGIVELDVEAHWPALEVILDTSFAAVDLAGAARKLEFGKELRCMTSFGTGSMGTRFISLLLSKGYLGEESVWHPAALEMCAGMIVGHRFELMALFATNAVPDLIYRQVEARCTADVRDQVRLFGTRARWNLFFVRSIAHNPKLRYLLMKYMFCSIALCNSVEDWAKQMGTFMIEALRAYAIDDDDPQRYWELSVEDVYASTSIRPIAGGGKRYVPRTRN